MLHAQIANNVVVITALTIFALAMASIVRVRKTVIAQATIVIQQLENVQMDNL